MATKLLRPLALTATAVALALTALPRVPAQAANVVNLRIFVGLGTGTDDNQRTDEDALAKLWNDAHPDIQIKFEYNDYSTARDVLLTQIAGGQAPDIVGPVGIGGLNSTGDLWADLGANIKKDTASLKLDDFEKATLGLYQLNGKDIAIPLGIYPSFMYVNKDLFEQASQPLPPTDYNNGQPQYQGKLWNMDAVKDLAIKLTQDKNGKFADENGFDPTNIAIYGFADIDIDMRGYAQLFSPGHSGVAKDGKTAIFNDKTYVQAMQWRHDAIFKYHFFPDASAQKELNNGGTTNTFASGRVAMSYSHTWALDGIKDLKAKWVIAVAPVAPNGKLTARINADTFAILDKSKHKAESWEVLKWLTSPEIAAKACAIYGCLPARISARADWEKDIKANYPDFDLKVAYGAVKYLDNPNSEAPMPNYNQAFDTFGQFFTQLDSDPNLDVKAGLDKLNTQMQLVFDGKVPTETPQPTDTGAAATAAPTMAATSAK
jgi:multiple sugar transport system substrate-binding protein